MSPDFQINEVIGTTEVDTGRKLAEHNDETMSILGRKKKDFKRKFIISQLLREGHVRSKS